MALGIGHGHLAAGVTMPGYRPAVPGGPAATAKIEGAGTRHGQLHQLLGTAAGRAARRARAAACLSPRTSPGFPQKAPP